MRKRYWLFFVAVLVIITVFVLAEEQFVGSFRQCLSDWTGNSGKQETNEKSFSIAISVESRAVCTVRLIDRHNGLFAAVAAFIIAWFTYTLDRSSSQLWRIEGRNFREAQRAFVFLDGFNVQLTTAVDSNIPGRDFSWLPPRYQQDPGLYITRFAVQPRWKNGGSTPTEALTIQINWSGPRGQIPPNYTYREPPKPFFVAPRAAEPSAFIEIPPAGTLVDWANNPVGPPPMILIWGRADYRDVFDTPHFIEWCYELQFARPIRSERMTASFVQWGDHNRSDNPQKSG